MPSYNHLKTQNFSVLLLLYCLVGQLCLTVSLWAPACQSSLSFTISQSLLKLMSAESVIPSNRFFLCCPLLLLPSIFPSIRVFSDGLALRISCQSIGASASASVLPMSLQDGLVGSPCSSRDSQESSPTPHFKSINSLVLSFLYSPTLTSIHDYGKTIALTRWTFVGKVMSLLFNMLSRLVITFLPRSNQGHESHNYAEVKAALALLLFNH